MPNVAFFSFSETDRTEVLLIKGRAVNPNYAGINFRVKDLLRRWNTTDAAVIRQAITKAMFGTSRTIVFVGGDTHASYWVPEEVSMTIANSKPIFAIRIPRSRGPVPSWLSSRGISIHEWSEPTLQTLATM
jgi:hypothetical protein